MTKIKCEWIYRGILEKPDVCKEKGVYLFIFNGTPKRIIYTGTAYSDDGFYGRWSEHNKLFKSGGRATFRSSEKSDIYELMKFKNNPEKYYKDLADRKLLWVNSDKKEGGYFINHYTKEITFKDLWKSYVARIYLTNIELWSCNIENKEYGEILETKLQVVLGKYYHIGFYDGYAQNWLGKQEKKGKGNSLEFKFTKFPVLDTETLMILENLYTYYRYFTE